MSIRLLAISGSARRQSHNRHLLAAMVEGARTAGAEVQVLDWATHALPIFDQDLEAAGVPAEARSLKAAFNQSDGFLIATPEYNSGYPALLKNAIDWASRSWPDDKSMVFKNKTVAIAGATIGRWGAVRSQRQLREVLGYLGCIVLPDSLSVNEAGKAFDMNGVLLDEKVRANAAAIGASLAKATAALRA